MVTDTRNEHADGLLTNARCTDHLYFGRAARARCDRAHEHDGPHTANVRVRALRGNGTWADQVATVTWS